MAGRIPLDFKKFKHIKSDDKTTTLQHPKDGHTITLVHKALSAQNQEQLKALSKIAGQAKQSDDRGEAKADSERTQNMAKGGGVSQKRDSKTIIAPSASEGIEISNEIRKNQKSDHGNTIQIPGMKEKIGKVEDKSGKKSDKSENFGKIKLLADGGEAEDGPSAEEQAKVPEALQPSSGELQPEDSVQKATAYDPSMPVPDDNQYYKEQFAKKMADPGLPGENRPDWTTPEEHKEAVLDEVLADKKNDKVDQENEQFDKAVDEKSKAAKEQQISAKAQELGVEQPPVAPAGAPQPEIAAPQGDQQPQVGGAQPPAQGLGGMPDLGSLAQTYYQKGKEAIQGQAGVEADLGKRQQAAIDQTMHQDQAIQDVYKAEGDKLNAQRDAIRADIANGHIDPDKYWTGYTTADGKQVAGHSRVASAIGMILAGFNPTNNPNAAINFLKHQMDQSMEAQKQNLQSSHNLLSANLAQYKNLTDATMATRLQMNEMMQHKLAAAGAQAKTEGAKFAAESAQSQLAHDALPLAQTLQMRQALMSLNNMGENKPFGSVGRAIQQVRLLNPEAAKEMESRYYPADDAMATKPISGEVSQKLDAHRQMDVQVRDLYNWAKTHSTAIPGTKEYNIGQQKALALQSAVREGQLGTVYREGEQPLLDKFVNSNPAGLLKHMKTMPQLEELLASNTRATNSLKQGVGLPVKQSQPIAGGNQNQAAMQWAKANPNDPRAAQILQRLGNK